jgi:uncharacterized protein (TIGR00266 family)
MTEKQWYVAVRGKQEGPFSEQEVVARIRAGTLGRDAHVFAQGMPSWAAISGVPTFAEAFASGAPTEAPPPPPAMGAAHEIDYEIGGSEMQYVEVTLDPGEACVAEAGAFFYMEPEIEMETLFGDGSQAGGSGFLGKLMQAGKRVLTGESLFITVFTNRGSGRRRVSFAAPYPGKVVPFDLRGMGGRVFCQKDAFLCAARGVSIGIAFQKKLGAGLFGGEGFILQKLEGDGLAFVHACGSIVERTLAAGETLRVDTGCLVAFEQTVGYDIQTVPGIKTFLFGGEGLFFAAVTGPGRVWLQTLPFGRLASRVVQASGIAGRGRREEGSVLGPLGNLLDGDG